MPPLPDFSAFAPGYATDGVLPDGDLRAAFFRGQRRAAITHLQPDELRERLDAAVRTAAYEITRRLLGRRSGSATSESATPQ